MKYYRLQPLFLMLALILVSCKSFEPFLLDASGEPFDPKLPTLRPVVENNIVAIVSQGGSTIHGANPFDIKTYFENEVQEIMTRPFEEVKGSIVLQVTNYEQKEKIGISPWLLGIPSLFGVPFYKGYSSVAVTIQVKTNSSKIIGQYKASAEHTEIASLYKDGGSYKEKDIVRVAYIKSVKKAVQEAKEKLESDIATLNENLKN